eukprot:jgi/Galph1/3859/GphlegSOOS_G2578.1
MLLKLKLVGKVFFLAGIDATGAGLVEVVSNTLSSKISFCIYFRCFVGSYCGYYICESPKTMAPFIVDTVIVRALLATMGLDCLEISLLVIIERNT